MPNSLLPLPNPLVTSPCNLIGYGVSGPVSGPASSGREDIVSTGKTISESGHWLFNIFILLFNYKLISLSLTFFIFYLMFGTDSMNNGTDACTISHDDLYDLC